MPRAWALLALVLLWAAGDHPPQRTDGRWYSLATLWAVLQQLFGEALLRRTADDAAFAGPSAIALWATALVCMLLPPGVWRGAGIAGGALLPQGGLWALGG